MKKIKWLKNEVPESNDSKLDIMDLENVKQAASFHKTIPGYAMTPLARLKHMADYLGLGDVFVKDESYRFNLNSFKEMGCSYAMANYIAKKTGHDISELDFDTLVSDKLRKELGEITFFAATDGNHGRAVAWAARHLKQKAIIFMPKGTTQNRLRNILAEHAEATIEDLNYDECVRLAFEKASEEENAIVIQDTASEGYEDISSWIMQGYGVLGQEAVIQLDSLGVGCPTHVFVQAGVGSFAGAIQGYFVNKYPDRPPIVCVVEPDTAACYYKSALAKDGSPHSVTGDMPTIMAGLACGDPNPFAWDIIKNHASVFIGAPDWVTCRGMRMLAAPIKGDPQVTSGESGAVPFGVLSQIMTDPDYADLKSMLSLDKNSRVLIFSTEGNTDPDRYREIVWEGKTYS